MVSAQGMQQESVSGAWMHSTLVFSSSQAIYGKRCLQKTKLPLALPHPSHSAQAIPTGRGRSKICRRMSRPTGHMRAHNFRGPLLRGCVSRTEPPGLAFGLGLTSWGWGVSVRDSGFHEQWTRRQCHSRPPRVCASCPRESVSVSHAVPEAWRAQYFIFGDNSSGEGRDTNSGRVSGIFCFYCVCVLLSCQHFFPAKEDRGLFCAAGPRTELLTKKVSTHLCSPG